MARFGTDDTGISSLLDIGGYYLSNDTAKDGVAFYKDGTIKRIDTGHGMNWFPISDGVYTISNDTIYAETFYYLGMNGGMQLAHLRFKVMDRNTIMFFEYAEDVGPRKMEKNWYQNKDLVDETQHFGAESIEDFVRKLGRSKGIKAHPHKFRRTGATFALRAGMPIEQVSKLLGHSNITTTQIYLDIREEDAAAAHERWVR